MRRLSVRRVLRLLALLRSQEVRALLSPTRHPMLVRRRRAAMILSRVRMVSGLMAILTPLWTFIDVLAFHWPLWALLGAERLAASFAFVLVYLGARQSESLKDAYRALLLVLVIPMLFFLLSNPLLGQFRMEGVGAMAATGYGFLPFVMAAGLGIFPVTALEGIVFSLPMLFAEAVVAIANLDASTWNHYFSEFWMLQLIAGVATLAGISQLHFMMALVGQAAYDLLTRAFTRQTGEELLDLQFRIAQRHGTPLAVAFIDLDDFKAVNDRFGHEEGDHILRSAADSLRRTLRRGDMLIRWGGEEFLVVLPNTDGAGAAMAVRRLRASGLGLRPDGRPQTASIGVAELSREGVEEWTTLVEMADQRMYKAKQAGKDRCVGCEGEVVR